MRMVVEARLEDNAGGSVPIRLAEIERADGILKQLGLSLAEGKSLVYEAQRALVNAQAHGFVTASRNCLQCGAALSIKAKHTIDIERFSARWQLAALSCVSASAAKT